MVKKNILNVVIIPLLSLALITSISCESGDSSDGVIVEIPDETSGDHGDNGNPDNNDNDDTDEPIVDTIVDKEWITWRNLYGGELDDCSYDIQLTADGGYVVAGYTRNDVAGVTDFLIVKLDSEGIMEWESKFGEGKPEHAYTVQQTSDGGYIVAGEKRIHTEFFDEYGFTSSYKYDFWILKLDSFGELEWEKLYGGDDYDRANSIIETSDGGYVVAGHAQSYGAEYDPEPNAKKDLWIMKLESDGEQAWERLYGDPDSGDGAKSVKETADGGYIVAGFTAMDGNGDYDFWVLKLDEFGRLDWEETYGGNYPEVAYSIDLTSDGGYVVAGETWSYGAGNNDFWVLKLNSIGHVAWSNTFGDDRFEGAKSVQQTSDNGYIVAGYTTSFGEGNRDCWLLRLNSDGSERWARAYGGESWDSANSVKQTADGSFIVSADSSSAGAGELDLLIFNMEE